MQSDQRGVHDKGGLYNMRIKLYNKNTKILI